MLDIKKFQFGADFDVKKAIQCARVKHDEAIQNAEILLSVREPGKLVPVCTRGNISAIIGKAKSRKTFCNTMLATALVKGSLYDKFIAARSKKLKVVYFDTEQGRGRAQRVVRRIVSMCGNSKQVDMISLRPYSTTERVEIIDHYFATEKPDFAFIDGVRDLIMDFNNLTQATDLMTSLMRWSEAHDCHIMCVLHMNKGDGNARGHLGSELMNKAESVISLAMEKGSAYSSIEPVFMRDGDFEPFQFTIVDGLPVLCGFENEVSSDKPVIDINSRIEPNRDFDTNTDNGPTPF